MRITICGSIAFIKEMEQLAVLLQELGHQVKFPPTKVPGEKGDLIDASEYYKFKKSSTSNDDWIWQNHSQRIIDHFQKITESDSVLIANYSKNGIENYIGPNTLMEMGVAFYLKKPIYLLNPIPEISYKEEILGVKPIVINGDLAKVKML